MSRTSGSFLEGRHLRSCLTYLSCLLFSSKPSSITSSVYSINVSRHGEDGLRGPTLPCSCALEAVFRDYQTMICIICPFILSLYLLPSLSNLTALCSAACWRETSPGCGGRPATPAPGSARPWPTPRTARPIAKSGARARRTTPRRRGSPRRRARGACARTRRRTTAARPPPGPRPRRPRPPRAPPPSPPCWCNAR